MALELEAVPTEQHILEALQALGVQQKAGKGKAPSRDSTAVPEPSLTKGTMYRLQLVLRMFAAICRHQHEHAKVSVSTHADAALSSTQLLV